MAKHDRHASVDELVKLTADLIDHVKVLVIAVDDLRCEVEWWARNAADQRLEREAVIHGQPCRHSAPAFADEVEQDQMSATVSIERKSLDAESHVSPVNRPEVVKGDSEAPNHSAIERLASLERDLASGPSGGWPDDWDEDEPPELPLGRVVRIDDDVWNWTLDMRPAHVVQMGCCCEEGIGAPYLLAWQNEDGCFLRELSEKESINLQQACLAEQRATEASQLSAPTAQQLALWQD